MLIEIAKPLANETTCKRILKEVIKQNDNLISGIKPCKKNILNSTDNDRMIMVIYGHVAPMDLITHFPVLCERHNIPYIFIDDKKYINNKTCVVLKNIDTEKYDKIVKSCCVTE